MFFLLSSEPTSEPTELPAFCTLYDETDSNCSPLQVAEVKGLFMIILVSTRCKVISKTCSDSNIHFNNPFVLPTGPAGRDERDSFPSIFLLRHHYFVV